MPEKEISERTEIGSNIIEKESTSVTWEKYWNTPNGMNEKST